MWGIRNPASSGRTIRIKNIQLQLFFDGTAVATLMRYRLIRRGSATSVTGAAVNAQAKNSLGTSSAIIVVADTGLGLITAAETGAICDVVAGRVTQTATNFASVQVRLDFTAPEEGIVLRGDEMMGLMLVNTAVIGDNVLGFVEFEEI